MTFAPSFPDPLAGVLDDLGRLDGQALRGHLVESLLLHGIEATASTLALPVLDRTGGPAVPDADRRQQAQVWTMSVLAALDEIRLPVVGPRPGTVVLAALSRQHLDVHLALLGAVLESRGWRVVVVGPDTPVHALALLPGFLSPTAVVVAAPDVAALRGHRRALSRLGRVRSLHVLLTGGGDAPRLPHVGLLQSDLGSAADRLDEVARDASAAADASLTG